MSRALREKSRPRAERKTNERRRTKEQGEALRTQQARAPRSRRRPEKGAEPQASRDTNVIRTESESRMGQGHKYPLGVPLSPKNTSGLVLCGCHLCTVFPQSHPTPNPLPFLLLIDYSMLALTLVVATLCTLHLVFVVCTANPPTNCPPALARSSF